MPIKIHNPVNIGTFNIATGQVNKNIVFTFDEEVGTPVITFRQKGSNTLVRRYNSNLSISGNRLSVTLQISGEDFKDHAGKTITAFCSFFNAGDVEMIFDLEIIDMRL